MDPVAYNNYMASVNQSKFTSNPLSAVEQRRIHGIPSVALNPFVLGPNVAYPYRSSQIGYGPFIGNPVTSMSDISSSMHYGGANMRAEKMGSYERAVRSNDLELKIIYNHLKKSKE